VWERLGKTSVPKWSRTVGHKVGKDHERAAPATQTIADLNPGPADSIPNQLAHGVPPFRASPLTEAFLVAATDGTSRFEPWLTDDTGAEPRSSLIPTRAVGRNPFRLTLIGGVVYFAANDGAAGLALWRSDGCREGATHRGPSGKAPDEGQGDAVDPPGCRAPTGAAGPALL
jgi:hypothetical protein